MKFDIFWHFDLEQPSWISKFWLPFWINLFVMPLGTFLPKETLVLWFEENDPFYAVSSSTKISNKIPKGDIKILCLRHGNLCKVLRFSCNYYIRDVPRWKSWGGQVAEYHQRKNYARRRREIFSGFVRKNGLKTLKLTKSRPKSA